MDRRHFLVKSATFLLGSLFGIKGFSKAFACGKSNHRRALQPRIALIIDDIGFSPCRARQFLGLDIPITYSVLPRLQYSQSLASEIHLAGHEIMLHQPMEPFNPEVDPGPGALYVGDEPERLVGVMEENISEIPFATGVNNHMGSRFTASRKEMREALEVIKQKDLFFVDSLTSNRSKAYETARSLHMVTACRNIFLDTRLNENDIFSQLRRLKRCALEYGEAIGIGHPFPETARAVDRFIKTFKEANITLVHVTDLLSPTGEQIML